MEDSQTEEVNMALSDYNLRYELPFDDVDGNNWRVRIYDRDDSGTLEILNGTGNPVNIYYEGDEDLIKGIIGSSCEINIYGVPDLLGGSDLSQFFTSDEEKYYVKVEYEIADSGIYDTYWVGFLHQDEYIEYITADPYEVKLVALDRLGTLETTLDSLGYYYDDNIDLIDVFNELVTATKLEFDIEENTFMRTENGDVSTFLQDQEITLQTYMESDKDFVKMKSLIEVAGDVALSIGSRVYQSKGKLMIRSISTGFDFGVSSTTLSIPIDAQPINDNLQARHLPAKRVTNVSYNIRSKNILTNPSFEKDSLLDTTPTGWIKPSGSGSIEVSDVTVQEGSNQSLKIIANRISDGTFNGASTATKNSTYCMLETTSESFFVGTDSFGGNISLFGVLDFSYFINNTLSSIYEFRISLEINNGTNDLYYNWDTRLWGTDFNHTFIDTESIGNWEAKSLEFLLNGSSIYGIGANNGATNPIVLRIHTFNYEESLSNVNIFVDNFSMKLYNATGGSKVAMLPSTRFYNTSTDDNNTTKSGAIDIELLGGITTLDVEINSFLADSEFYLLYGKVLGQYINKNTGVPEDTAFYDSALVTYLPMPQTFSTYRRNLEDSSKAIFSSTLATHRIIDGGILPFTLPRNAVVTNGSDITYTDSTQTFDLGAGYAYPDIAEAVITPTSNTLSTSTEAYKMTASSTDLLAGDQIVIRIRRDSDDFVLGIIILTADEPLKTVDTTSFGDDYKLTIGGFSTGSGFPRDFSINYLAIHDSAGIWTPVHFDDYINVDFGVGVYQSLTSKVFSRFGLDLKDNRYQIDAVNLP